MRILLINPPSQGMYYRIGLFLPPLGLSYLAAVLRERGHDVNIIDLNVYKGGIKAVDFKNWDIVGISGDTSRHPVAMDIACRAKESGATVVMGGYHVTFLASEALDTGYVDYVVRGEGEIPLLELVECLEGRGDPKKVKGICFKQGSNLIRTPDAPVIEDIETIPLPARDLLNMGAYKVNKLEGRPLTTIVSSRGCPYSCTFCASSHFAGRKWRWRSAKNVVDEIQHVMEQYGYRAVAFMDDNFTLSARRVIQICEEILRRGLDVFWWCFSRVDTIVKNEPMVELMAKAGAKMVFLGIESSSEAMLKAYGKKFSSDLPARAISILKRYGIKVWASFIIGGLNETIEMIRQTVQYAKWLNPDIAEFSILTPFPGTELYQQALREGRIVNKNWSKYDGGHAVMRTDFLTPMEVARETIFAYIKFYGRWSRMRQVMAGLKTAIVAHGGVVPGLQGKKL